MKPRPEIKGLTLVEALKKCQELAERWKIPGKSKHVYRRASNPKKMLYTHPDLRAEPMTVQWREHNPDELSKNSVWGEGQWVSYERFSVEEILATDWEVVYFDRHLRDEFRE